MNLELYKGHIKKLATNTRKALETHGFDDLIISSGALEYYFADDMSVPFKKTPHFSHWCPLPGPGHLIHLSKDDQPTLIVNAPDDFWHIPTSVKGLAYLECFEVKICKDFKRRFDLLDELGKAAFIGFDKFIPDVYESNPEALTKSLDWNRSYKTDWEIYCIESANEIAAGGHKAAKECFLSGGSEFDVYMAYLKEIKHTSFDLPYEAIIGFDEHASTLHYEKKMLTGKGTTLLIDAGANFYGYASDITRTTLAEKRKQSVLGGTISDAAHDVFKQVLFKLDRSQVDLVGNIRLGQNYLDIHRQSCLKIFEILCEVGLILECPAEDKWKYAAVRPFFPHGLGHMLGIQVHDVSGKQQNMSGSMFDPNSSFPNLRNLRVIEKGHVFTIEPGVYFIPALLKNLEDKKQVKIDYKLFDELKPLGGIRIEDNVRMAEDGPQNITRTFLT